MSKPIRKTTPELALRNGTYYAAWYDPARRRTQRTSLRTSDPDLAASALLSFQQPATPYQAEHRGDSEKGPKLKWGQWATKMCKRARENAKAKGRAYDISPEFVGALLAAQGHRCAVTSIPFSNRAFYRNPFAPSLDQIRPGGGYVENNVRIVSVIVNTAMNGWGEGPLHRLIYESRVLGHWQSKIP